MRMIYTWRMKVSEGRRGEEREEEVERRRRRGGGRRDRMRLVHF